MTRRTIGLLGPYGHGNLGDAAIQDAMLANLRRRRPGARIVGLSLNPADTTERHGIPAYRLYPKLSGGAASQAGTGEATPARPQSQGILHPLKAALRRRSAVRRALAPAIIIRDGIERAWTEARFSFRAWQLLREFELLVISGGGQVDDSWGGPWRHPFTMFRWTLLARLAGVRVVFLSIGAGPLNARLSRIFCRWALGLGAYTSYRDAESLAFVRGVLGRKDGRVVADLAYSLESPPAPARGSGGGSGYAAVGPMPYFDPRSWPDKHATTYSTYLELMLALVVGLVDRGFRVVLFGSDIHMDELVIQDLLARVADHAPGALNHVSYRPTPTVPALASILRGAEVVVASRYHGALLSHLVGTPVVALSYHPKVNSLMKDAGQAEYCLDLAGAGAPDVLGRIDELLGRLPQVRDALRRRAEEFRSRLEAQYEEVFGGAPGGGQVSHGSPRVSIGLPVYNGERYLRLALDSLLRQTFTDFELVISDNASTDATEAICREYALRDPRVRYHRNARNIGGSRNHNRVVELSVGEYFLMGAHDDLRAPDYLRRCVEVLDADPTCVICFSKTEWIDEEGRPLPAPGFDLDVDSPDPVVRFREIIRMDHDLAPIYGLMRTAILKRTPLEGQYADCDRVELAELALYGRFVQLPEVLFFRREHPGQSTRMHRSRQARTAWFDPDAPDQLVFPYFRQLGEYLLAIHRVPQPTRVRRRCLLAMAGWIKAQRRQLRADVRDGAFCVGRRIIPQPIRRRLRNALLGPPRPRESPQRSGMDRASQAKSRLS